jgi:hypothetical protein
MMFEHRSKPVIPFRQFAMRVMRYTIFSGLLIGFSLFIGIIGYHELGNLPWLDALVNASMILTGMGPVDVMQTDAAKWFTSFYALFSGVFFLSTVAVFLAPIVHRFLHIHLLDEGK